MEGISATAGARFAGVVAGLAIVGGVALQSWRVAPSSQALGLDLTVEAAASGELAVEPTGPVVRSRMLLPGSEHTVQGEMRVINQTGGRLAAWPRLAEGSRALDGLVQLRIDRGGNPVFRGTAAELRSGAGRPIVVHRGASATLTVKAWLPEGSASRTMGRTGTWRLSFAGRER